MAMTQERKRDFTQHWSSIKPMILNVKPSFQWPFQEPIDWRYRFHIFLVYFSGLNFKIQDSQELSGANLESWIQDLLERVPRNLESWIQGLDSRFGFKICSKESLGILNLESWIQDLLERARRNLESWILNPSNLQWHCNAIASWIGVKEVKAAKRSSQGSKKVGLGGGTIYIYISCIYAIYATCLVYPPVGL